MRSWEVSVYICLFKYIGCLIRRKWSDGAGPKQPTSQSSPRWQFRLWEEHVWEACIDPRAFLSYVTLYLYSNTYILQGSTCTSLKFRLLTAQLLLTLKMRVLNTKHMIRRDHIQFILYSFLQMLMYTYQWRNVSRCNSIHVLKYCAVLMYLPTSLEYFDFLLL